MLHRCCINSEEVRKISRLSSSRVGSGLEGPAAEQCEASLMLDSIQIVLTEIKVRCYWLYDGMKSRPGNRRVWKRV